MTFHSIQTLQAWSALPQEKQILNIASELTRSLRHYRSKESKYLASSMDRAFELLDSTIADVKWIDALYELLRLREMLGEFYISNRYSFTEFERVIRALLLFHPKTSFVQLH